MATEPEEVTRNGDLNSVNVDNDGFQKVLTSSERRVLKKKQTDVKRVTLVDCNSLENSILSRLKKRGLDLKNDPDHSTVEASTVEPEELAGMISELEEAITGVLFNVEKPDQNLSVTELDNRIKLAKSNLAQMKTRKKGVTVSKEELLNATKEADVYVAYLQQQISLTREYQKLKTAQSSLLRLKNALKDLMTLKNRMKSTVLRSDRNKVSTPTGETRVLGTTKRSMEYVYEFIKEMKDRHGETFEAKDLTSQDHKLVDGTKFQHPYTYMQKLKQRFDVFIDKTGTKPVVLSVYGCQNDVKNCVEFLAGLDMAAENKLPMSFTKYRLLMDQEEKFNVMLNYNSGMLEVLGASADVKSFMDHVEANSKDNASSDSKDKDGSDRDSSKGSDVTDLASSNHKMFDYYVLRALSGKFRANVRELETEYGVGIKFDLTPRNGLAKVSFVPLLDNSIDKCVEGFTNYVEEYAYKDLGKLTQEELTFLSDNEVLRKRYRSQYTTLVKSGDKVYVVGLKKHLNFGFNRAQHLLESRQVPPVKLKVSNSQYQLVLPHLNTLQDQRGVYVTTTNAPSTKDREGSNGEKAEKEGLNKLEKEKVPRDRGDRELTLVIHGNTSQQKEAMTALNEMLTSFVNREVGLSGVEYNVLFEEKNKLQELETRHKVKLTLSKNSLNLSGPKAQVELVLDELKALFAKVVYVNLHDQIATEMLKNHNLVYAVLVVPQKSLGKIIGKGGSMLKQILLQSSLTNIVITKCPVANAASSSFEGMHDPGLEPGFEEPTSNGATSRDTSSTNGTGRDRKPRDRRDREVDVLLMIGNGLAVNFTVGLVKQVLESDDDAPLTKTESRSLYDEYTSKHSIMRRSNPNSASSTSRQFKSEEKLDINDPQNFPSL